MATVLHKTTKQLLKSVHTPNYPSSDWIHNPDMSSVAGVPSKYWKVTGDVITEMSAAEKDTAELANVKAAKIVEIDAKTTSLIALGFAYASKQFSLSAEARDSVMGLMTIYISYSPWPLPWNTIDDLDKYEIVDSDDALAFCQAGYAGWTAPKLLGTALKDDVRVATTIAAVDAVVDNR